jgi:hypothetical protein
MAFGPSGSRFRSIAVEPALNALGNIGGRFRSLGNFSVLGAGLVRASLSTARGSNKDITVTAKQAGLRGNNYQLAITTPGGANAALSVVTTNPTPGTTLVTVNTATNGSSVGVSTGNQIIAAINGDATASSILSAATKTGSDGTGVWLAADNLAATNLTGGAAASVGSA